MSGKKLSVGVLFGGASSEYEVSLISATSILNNINYDKYDIYKIGITKQGSCFLYEGGITDIKNDSWQQKDCTPCIISHDPAHHGIVLLNDQCKAIKLDCVFPVLHGKNGEDGTIQGLLTLADIPFVGCDVLSSASCMDKAITKSLLDNAQINNAPWVSILKHDYTNKPHHYIDLIENKIKYPCFIKPANAGSSVGVSKAIDHSSLITAIELAFIHDKKIIVEKAIIGKEIECAVLGNNEPIASVLGEIIPSNEFYDYEAKYISNESLTNIPADMGEMVSEQIKEIAIKAYKTLGCEGLARVDFFLTQGEEIILNEINTIPGFTHISMYPKLFEASGVSYSELIDRLILLALERNGHLYG